jgi:orotidine-5'-phosphate decarboxylase
MDYLDLLRKKAIETKSIVCVGLDPILEKIPIKGRPKEIITKFYLDILKEFIENNTLPAAVKPNIAFYEQYGFEGLEALQIIVKAYKENGIIVIVDAKRADIGKTSQAYATAMYDFWDFDAMTVAPYMGSDSVLPFIEYCKKGKGVYILNRTSNSGAIDIQDLNVDGVPLYIKITQKIIEWASSGTGAVIGATYPKELEKIARLFVDSGKKIPILIPGVGSQGGSAGEVVTALKNAGYDLSLARINSSSAINYAYLQQGTDDYAGAAVKELKKLNKEINFIVN